jgi:Fanconi anemia group J protein
MILTSGTLTPIDSFEKELQVPFKYKLEAKHVVDMDQVMISILSRGFNKESLNFSYKSCRESDKQLDDLAYTLKNISDSTKGGILVFFPSYASLQKMVKYIKIHKFDFKKLLQFET